MHLLIGSQLQHVPYLDHPVPVGWFLPTHLVLAAVGAPGAMLPFATCGAKIVTTWKPGVQRFCAGDPWIPKAFGRRE